MPDAGMLSFPGSGALWLSVRLATITTLVLLLIGTPLAWWLAHTSSRWKAAIEALVALPIVLPPTVMGFYLLVVLGPYGTIGRWWVELTGDTLTFSFTGLVLASCLYSLPFAVQPMQNAFESLDRGILEAAWTLGASRIDAFFSIAVPQSARGFLNAVVLAFAHTLGEFGVVLMVGGNIPGATRTISIAIYDRVQAFDTGAAAGMSALLLGFSLAAIWLVYVLGHRMGRRDG